MESSANEILSAPCGVAESGAELGPRLKELLLAQPLNPLRKLRFKELPSRPPNGVTETANLAIVLP